MVALENHFGDMQDIEFTVQDGELFILQTRNGKRLPKAAFKIALDMIDEGTWDLEYALEQLSADQYKQLSTVEIRGVCPEPTGTGIAAGGSIVIGKAVFDASKAVKSTSPVILIRKETDPDDVLGMAAAVGILTSTGGKTSHAAVVSRGFGKTCVVGLTDLLVHENGAAVMGHEGVEEGDLVAIDGETGRVWFNVVPEIATLASGHVGHELMRRVLVSQGKAEVGELDDLSNDRPIVIRAATWTAPMVELRALKKVCAMDGIDLRQVTIDLRDAIVLTAEDQTLFGLAGVENTSNEKGRIFWAEEFEGTAKRGATKGSGFRYLTSTPTTLPGVEQIKSLDALMQPGVVSPDPWMGSPDTLKTIMEALKAQGHEVATLYAGAARLDEVAFDVLQ
jgi:phosphohistidine swiveling domain-containing protein